MPIIELTDEAVGYLAEVHAVQKHGFGRCQVNRQFLDASCEPILQRIGSVLTVLR